MSLRKINVLKISALILFVFELMAPLFAEGISKQEEFKNGHQVLHTIQLQNPFTPLLLEELSKNEEEKDGQKVVYSTTYRSRFILPHLSFDIHQVNASTYTHSLQQFALSPALFQVHCKLVI